MRTITKVEQCVTGSVTARTESVNWSTQPGQGHTGDVHGVFSVRCPKLAVLAWPGTWLPSQLPLARPDCTAACCPDEATQHTGCLPCSTTCDRALTDPCDNHRGASHHRVTTTHPNNNTQTPSSCSSQSAHEAQTSLAGRCTQPADMTAGWCSSHSQLLNSHHVA